MTPHSVHRATRTPMLREVEEEVRALRRVRIFLAEDDADLRALLARVLRDDGFEVVEAEDGSDLLDHLGSSLLEDTPSGPLDVDVILADVCMPGCKGIDLLAGLRDAGWRTPVILMTAFPGPDLRARARRLGATAFLPKPIDLDELRTVLEDVVPSLTPAQLGPERPRSPGPLARIMTTALVSVTPETTVREALSRADDEGIHHLIVMDRGELVGVVCEYDLGQARPAARVGDCMSAPPFCIDSSATLEDAAELMRERVIGCLPVMTAGTLVGVVTRGDLRRAGLPHADVAGRACASCGREDHVRLDLRTEGSCFCLDCRERARASASENEVGGSG